MCRLQRVDTYSVDYFCNWSVSVSLMVIVVYIVGANNEKSAREAAERVLNKQTKDYLGSVRNFRKK